MNDCKACKYFLLNNDDGHCYMFKKEPSGQCHQFHKDILAKEHQMASLVKATTDIHFWFTVECPHCGNLFEVSHLAIEVLFTGTELGKCSKCDSMITVHLSSSNAEVIPT